MGVSNPTNFVHKVHVGFDPISGESIIIFCSTRFADALPLPGAFTGMPEQWSKLLTKSAMTREVCYNLLPFSSVSFCFASTVIVLHFTSQTVFPFFPPPPFICLILVSYMVIGPLNGSHPLLLFIDFPYVPAPPICVPIPSLLNPSITYLF